MSTKIVEPTSFDRVKAYLKAYPGSTRREVYEALGISRQRLSQIVTTHGLGGFGPAPGRSAITIRACVSCGTALDKRTTGDLCRNCMKRKTYPCQRCGVVRTRRSRKRNGEPSDLCRKCWRETVTSNRRELLTLTCANPSCGEEFIRTRRQDSLYLQQRSDHERVACGSACGRVLGRGRGTPPAP